MLIDVHAHHMPADYLALVRGMGGSYQDRFVGMAEKVSLDERFAMMDDAGVARQILSPMTAPYSNEPDRAIAAAQWINGRYAELREAHPDRFRLWVSLPLPHVDAALAELGRGMDELGGSGVVLGCACLGGSIAAPEFDPLYAEMNRRGTTVFLHPCQNGICSPLVNEWGLTVCAGASMEDSVAAMHLIAARIPERFPALRFIVPHFGGLLPTLLERLDGQMPQTDFAEKPSATARRFFYDTVGWGSRAALISAVEAFGAGQIVTGSDFPILLNFESYRQTFAHIGEAGLPAETVDTILGNAARLVPD